MTNTPIGNFLARVASRLQPQRLDVLNAPEVWPMAPGHFSQTFDVDAPIGAQRISATLENDLTLTVFSSLTLTLQFSGLVKRPNGETQPIGPNGGGFFVSVVGDRVPRSFTFPRGSGVDVLGLTVVAINPGFAVPLGSVWAIVQQSRTLADGSQVITSTLVSGPVSVAQALGWPGSPVQPSTNVPYSRSFNGTTPAVTLAFTQTVPAGVRWDLQTFYTVYQAGNVSGTQMSFECVTGVGAFVKAFLGDPAAVAVNTTVTYVIGPGLPVITRSDGALRNLPWPGITMLAGDVFLTQHSGFGGSQFGAPQLTVLERLDP